MTLRVAKDMPRITRKMTFEVIDPGKISDGYHTFDELYEHRCLLFINLCLVHRAHAYWRPHYLGWPLIGLETQFGQITYHVPERLLPLFKEKIREGGPEWDGHTSQDVVERLRRLAEEAHESPPAD